MTTPLRNRHFEWFDLVAGLAEPDDPTVQFRREIETSPVGPIRLTGYRDRLQVPSPGSGVLLPLAPCVIEWAGCAATIERPGSFAVVPAGAVVTGGYGLLIYTPAYAGYPQVGGPLEAAGRLKYIDGCSDTLLVCPPVLGEPCLNHLHLPGGINQTAHVHPSDRIGIIVAGSGQCWTPDGRYDLTPGMFWRIPQGGEHSFHTADQSLDVLAWHPDSTFGPKHDDHPMLSRTIVDGDPANAERHRAIRTTEIRA